MLTILAFDAAKVRQSSHLTKSFRDFLENSFTKELSMKMSATSGFSEYLDFGDAYVIPFIAGIIVLDYQVVIVIPSRFPQNDGLGLRGVGKRSRIKIVG